MYLNGAISYEDEKNKLVKNDFSPEINILEKEDGAIFIVNFQRNLKNF